MKSIYILDVSGSMTEDMIERGHQSINLLIDMKDEKEDETALVVEWNPIGGLFCWLVEDLRKYCPEAKLHYICDQYQIVEDIMLVDHVTIITPTKESTIMFEIDELDSVSVGVR